MCKFKLLATSLIALSVFMIPLTSFADTYTEDGTHTMEVKATVESTYQVIIPAILNLTYDETKDSHEGTYEVGAKGNIAYNKRLEFKPSSNSFIMTASAGENVIKETASISQAKTIFETLTSDYTKTSGTVSVKLIKAGNYSGDVLFEFGLIDYIPR